MCGIFGYSTVPNGLTIAERAIFAAACGNENDSRGGDSWGVYAVNGKPNLVKGLGKIKGGFGFPALFDCDVFMGHTRKATTGKISWDNAHPFKIGAIIGAHNGYVSNYQELNKKYDRTFEVDSMHIFAHLAEHKPFSELYGWGAIEWSNARSPKKIRLCRFAGGQLSVYGICRTPEEAKLEGHRGDVTIAICWSSSDWHIRDALALAGLTERSFEYKVETEQVYLVDSGHYCFDGKRQLVLGEEHYTTNYNSYSGGRGGGHFQSKDEYWKNQTRSTHSSTETSGAGFKSGAVFRKAKRMGRFAVVADAISSVYVDPEVVRGFFEDKELYAVLPLIGDEDGTVKSRLDDLEAALAEGRALIEKDEAKRASEAILKALEEEAAAVAEGLAN